MKNRGGSGKQTEGDGSTVPMGEICPLPSLHGSGDMVSGCEACQGTMSTCVGSRHLLSPKAEVEVGEDTGVSRQHCGAAQNRNLVHEVA